jgi:hypothetical protein
MQRLSRGAMPLVCDIVQPRASCFYHLPCRLECYTPFTYNIYSDTGFRYGALDNQLERDHPVKDSRLTSSGEYDQAIIIHPMFPFRSVLLPHPNHAA